MRASSWRRRDPRRRTSTQHSTKLLGPNPEAKLGAAFTEATQTSGKLDYETDVKPWLGGPSRWS
jgi:hypothetical protein